MRFPLFFYVIFFFLLAFILLLCLSNDRAVYPTIPSSSSSSSSSSFYTHWTFLGRLAAAFIDEFDGMTKSSSLLAFIQCHEQTLSGEEREGDIT
jgi:quinol-cytochrome oxidoreductase complex cytochrome b subunit